MATPEQILTEWRKMKAAYPSSFVRADDDEITANQLVWVEQLSDIDPDLLRAACAHYRSSDAEWFPPAGKIRKMVLDLSEPNHRRTGIEAWGDVVKAFHTPGYYGSPEFCDPVVVQVVKSLGWQALCISEDQTADRARFIDGYNAIAGRERSNALMLPDVKRVAEKQLERAGEVIKRLAESKALPQ
jgi:hypothetical protein